MRKLAPLFLLLPFVALPFACDQRTPAGPEDAGPISLDIIGGQGQTGEVGTELPDPVRVQATYVNAKGKTENADGLVVNFVVVAGGGSVFAGSALTDKNGIAADRWTLGPEPGLNSLEVRSVDSDGVKRTWGVFEATSNAPACTPGETQTRSCGVNGTQTRTCEASEEWGDWGDCEEQCVPEPEVCDGIDNDCNGTVDDGAVCTAPNAICACVNGSCSITSCDAGWSDCNDSYSDGCEIDTSSNTNNCGACGVVCPTGYICADGTCVEPACSPGETEPCGVGGVRTCSANSTWGSCEGDCGLGNCYIDGQCVSGGDPNPSNECEWCDPTVDPFVWTPLNGTTCAGGTCQSGVCVGGGC